MEMLKKGGVPPEMMNQEDAGSGGASQEGKPFCSHKL